jgi:hypothetical protein
MSFGSLLRRARDIGTRDAKLMFADRSLRAPAVIKYKRRTVSASSFKKPLLGYGSIARWFLESGNECFGNR